MSKVPEFLHLAFKEQVQYIYGEDLTESPTIKILLPLAFSIAYEPTKKTYQKQYETQMNWAYSLRHSGYIVREDGVYANEYKAWAHGWMGPNGEGYTMMPPERVKEYLQPRIMKNDPMEGFKISHSVSRYRTSNKLWRIEDPRGFEFEISTGNMEALLVAGTVEKGAFKGAMQWQTGKILKWA